MGFWLHVVIPIVVILRLAIWIIDKITINIDGRHILVTGCDTGFGNIVSKQLDKRGCHVYATCLTQKGAADLKAATSSRLKTVIMDVTKSDSIKAAYHEIRDMIPVDKGKEWLKTVIMDVTKSDSIKATYHEIRDMIPADKGLWGLINNAGVTGQPGHYNWWTREEIRFVIEVNLLGVVEVTNVFLPLIKKAKGRVVNISSALGIFSMPSGGYEMAKYGVEAFSDGLRRLMIPYGVSVHILEPGYFRTAVASKDSIFPLMDKAWNRLTPEEREEYGEDYYTDYKKVMAECFLDNASDKLHLVTDSMIHALSAWWPWRRYLPGWDAKLVYKPLSMLPAFITDNLELIFRVKVPIPKACRK